MVHKRDPRSIISTTKPTFVVFTIDGTTIALAPEKELQTHFPPASNQLGEGTWPIALLTVFHELETGCALPPEVGAMYGQQAVSETELARRGMVKLPEDSIILGDSAFGIFGVAHQAKRCGHEFVFAMKKANFQSLSRKAELTSSSEPTRLSSTPGSQPKATSRATHSFPQTRHVYLHEVAVTEKLTLYLVSSTAAIAVRLRSKSVSCLFLTLAATKILQLAHQTGAVRERLRLQNTASLASGSNVWASP